MIKFYKLAKISEPGGQRIGFLREEGYFLPNNYSLALVVYRDDSLKWYVVELTSGTALGEGITKTKAVQNFEHNVERCGISGVKKAIDRSIELYGMTPDHRETEVF